MIKYRHYKNQKIYTLICEAHQQFDPRKVDVIYQDEHLNFWSRPREEFYGLVNHDGRMVERFKEVYRDNQSPLL